MSSTDNLGAAGSAKATTPHGVLNEYYGSEAERRQFLDEIFDRTAKDYDRIEWWLGFGSGPWYRRQALLRAGLRPGMRMVDVGVGTGLVSAQALKILNDPTLIVGVDPSPGMLANARLPAELRLVKGTGESIPFPEQSFDFLSMGFALRHLSSLELAFAEFYRVLAPGARVCLLEITRPKGATAMLLLKVYLRAVVPILARLLTRDADTARIWRYYWDTIEACVDPETVMQALRNAGFSQVQRHVELGIFSEYTATR